MKPVKVWTLKEQAEYHGIKPLEIGTFVTPKRGVFTGDKGNLNKHAEIVGLETRSIDSMHTAYEKFGCTHEELYKVKYEDGKRCVLWLEECDVLLIPKRGVS